MVKKNTMREKLMSGQPVIGCVVLGNWPEIVEMIGLIGFDYVWFDGEHGVLGLPEVAHLVRAAECANITPIVRVPRNAPDVILGYLDLGVQGIMVPRVDSRREAEQAVKAAKYYPEGDRGMGYGHATDYWLRSSFKEYIETANKEIMVITQCETKEGLANLDEIVKVPGLDIVMIGPTDLSLSLGIPGQFDSQIELEAIAKAVKITVEAGKIAGTVGQTGDHARELIDKNVRFIAVGVHEFFLSAAKQYLSKAKAGH